MERKEAIQLAVDTLKESYAPYSKFHVAAVLVAKDGQVFKGINIENAAYSPTNCAERTAFFTAVCAGVREFEYIVITGGKHGIAEDFCPPCGVCRQVMMEFCDPKTFKVIVAKSPEEYKEFTLEEILPLGFGPGYLREE